MNESNANKDSLAISPRLAALLAKAPKVSEIDQGRLQRAGEQLHADPVWCGEGMKGYFVNEMLLAMEQQKISQSELAEKLGKSRQYVSKVLAENKRINFTIETMHAISHALNRRLELVVIKPPATDCNVIQGHWHDGDSDYIICSVTTNKTVFQGRWPTIPTFDISHDLSEIPSFTSDFNLEQPILTPSRNAEQPITA